MGPSIDCKPLLPHPDAAIFVDNFPSTDALGEYLVKLTQDEKAYEKHREWRIKYMREGKYPENHKIPDLLTKSWPCRQVAEILVHMHIFKYLYPNLKISC